MKHAFVHFEADVGLPREDWDGFCAAYEIEHDPEAAGGNVWRHGGKTGVECIYGGGNRRDPGKLEEAATEIMFVTPWGGPKMNELAKLAMAFWCRFGGALYAEEEIRRLICEMLGALRDDPGAGHLP